MQKRNDLITMLALPIALVFVSFVCGCAVSEMYVSPAGQAQGEVVMRVASAQNSDAFEAGRAAAQALAEQLGPATPHAVVLAECFEEASLKKETLKGVCSVFPREIVFGGATYGSFAQAGCLATDSVGLLAIGGLLWTRRRR